MNDNSYKLTDRFLVMFFALLGAVLIAYGSLCPLFNVDIVGEVNYYSYADFEKFICYGATLLVLVCAVRCQYRWLRLYVVVAVLAPFYTYIHSLFKEESFFEKMGHSVSDSLTDFGMHFVDFSWGGLILLAGFVSLMLTAIFSFRQKKKPLLGVY